VARTSSAKKIARLAEKGKGKKVRFQGGSVFPTVVLAVLVLGAVLIAYARQGGTAVDATVTAEQKYATAFAFFNCDALATDLKQPDAATLNPTDKFVAVTTDAPAAIIGDGIVGWMPQALAGQRKAKLDTIFGLYGMTVTEPKSLKSTRSVQTKTQKLAFMFGRAARQHQSCQLPASVE